MNKDKLIRYILFFVLLFSLSLYRPVGLNEEITKLLYYSVGVLFGILALSKRVHVIKYFDTFSVEYALILFGILSSIFMSSIYQGQPIWIGFMTTLPYFTYALYFIFKKGDIHKSTIENYIFIFAGLTMIVMLVNFIFFPDIIFGRAEIDPYRGGIRMRVPGIYFVCLAFFLSIHKNHMTPRKKWILLCILCYIFILLSLTRQLIFVTTILGGWFLLARLKWTQKIAVMVVITAVLGFVLPHVPFVQNMIQLTAEQSRKNTYEREDVRLGAWRFYTTEVQPNAVTHIFGCGQASFGNSSYGDRIEKEMEFNRYYYVDVGYAGFYYLFGAIATAGLVLLLIKGSFTNKNKKDFYANYYLLTVLLTSFASGPVLYQYEIITIVLSTYILSIKKDLRDYSIRPLYKMRYVNGINSIV